MTDPTDPPQTFEITWKTGHVERIYAHQVTFPLDDSFRVAFGGTTTRTQRDPRVQFHGYVGEKWTLILSALEADIRTVRNCVTEQLYVEGLGPIGGDSNG